MQKLYGINLSLRMCLTVSIFMLFATFSYAGKNFIPVPEGAYDIKRTDLPSDSARQLDFKVNVTYMSTEIADYYYEFFSNKDWKICENTENSDSDSWIKYEEKNNGGYEMIAKNVRYMASDESSNLLMISLRHSIENTEAKEEIGENNEHQYVTVVFYELDQDSLDQTASVLSLDCS